jgi:hypothetical protein
MKLKNTEIKKSPERTFRLCSAGTHAGIIGLINTARLIVAGWSVEDAGRSSNFLHNKKQIVAAN